MDRLLLPSSSQPPLHVSSLIIPLLTTVSSHLFFICLFFFQRGYDFLEGQDPGSSTLVCYAAEPSHSQGSRIGLSIRPSTEMVGLISLSVRYISHFSTHESTYGCSLVSCSYVNIVHTKERFKKLYNMGFLFR